MFAVAPPPVRSHLTPAQAAAVEDQPPVLDQEPLGAQVENTEPAVLEALLDHLFLDDYSAPLIRGDAPDEHSYFHTQVFYLGLEFKLEAKSSKALLTQCRANLISSLKELLKDNRLVNSPTLMSLIREAYRHSTTNDQGFRRVIRWYLGSEMPKLMNKTRFRRSWTSIDGFADDMMAEQLRTVRKMYCRDCQQLTLHHSTPAKCRDCKHSVMEYLPRFKNTQEGN